MRQLTSGTFDRPTDVSDRRGPRVLYARSYLLTRAIVRALEILPPISLVVAEASLDGSVLARGSLSAYYHTAARNVWVARLSLIGVLLVTYLSGQTYTREVWLSLTAGLAALVVVFFPTARPGVVDTARGAARIRCRTAASRSSSSSGRP